MNGKEFRKIFIMLGAVAILFVATILMFVYQTFTPGSGSHNETPAPIVNNSDTTPEPKPTTTPQIETPPHSDAHTAMDDCIELKAAEAAGQEYEKGSLLVSFLSAVSYDVAIASIEALNLRADTSTEARANFNTYHWLPVTVKKGEEFKMQCVLDSAEGIRKANLNFTFNLRQ